MAGIAVDAAIQATSTDTMAGIMGKGAWWSVPAAVILGVPMYSNAAGVLPVIEALIDKGAALGTALAFMMSVVALCSGRCDRPAPSPEVATNSGFYWGGGSRDHGCRLYFQPGLLRRNEMVKIEVLGSGCANCQRLEMLARRVSRSSASRRR